MVVVAGYFTPLFICFVTELHNKQTFLRVEEAALQPPGAAVIAVGRHSAWRKLPLYAMIYLNLVFLLGNAVALMAFHGML